MMTKERKIRTLFAGFKLATDKVSDDVMAKYIMNLFVATLFCLYVDSMILINNEMSNGKNA
jgi:hypothetical protein